MTSKEICNKNLHKSISGMFGKKLMGTHCNALMVGFHTKPINFKPKFKLSWFSRTFSCEKFNL
jgi:hypothetical protein